jgi:Zn-dependent protease
MSEYFHRLRHHFSFNRKELISFAVATVLLAFIFGFDDGRATFSFAPWFGNYILVLILVFIALFFRVAIQKMVALAYGINAQFKMWSYGLAIGAALILLSNGKLILLLPGSIMFVHLTSERLGQFRYGLNYGDCGRIAALGSVANMVLGMFTKQMMRMLNFSSPVLDKLIYINFLLALFMMLPIPPMDGITSFFGSRMTYVVIFGLIFGYVVLYVGKIYSLFLAIFIAVIVWALYYIFFEKESW